MDKDNALGRSFEIGMVIHAMRVAPVEWKKIKPDEEVAVVLEPAA